MAEKRSSQVVQAPEVRDGVVQLPVRAGERIDLSAYELSEVKTDIQGDDLLLELPFDNFILISDFFDYLEHPNPPKIIFKDYPNGLVPEVWFEQSQIGDWLSTDGTSSETASSDSSGADHLASRGLSIDKLESGRKLDILELEPVEIIPLDESIEIPPDNNTFLASLFEEEETPVATVNDIEVLEDAGVAVFEVNLSNAFSEDVMIDFETQAITATDGVDFNNVQGTLLIPAGATSGTIEVPILNDDIIELPETFRLTLSNPLNVILPDTEAIATIMDEGDPIFELSGLQAANGGDGRQGSVFNGVAFLDLSGFAVSGAGDVNGDGLDDIVIGAFLAIIDNTFSVGRVAVIFGQTDPFAAEEEISDLLPINGGDGMEGFLLNGYEFDDVAGQTVSSAGDINGDGFSDILIGAPESNTAGGADAGRGYVVFGGEAPFPAERNLGFLFSTNGGDGSEGFSIDGDNTGDFIGVSVSELGDINGDGLDDLIIGGTRTDGESFNSGAAAIVFGRNTGFDAEFFVQDLDGSDGFRLNGELLNDRLGDGVGGAGDINGDGFNDIFVGASGADPNGPQSGQAFVVFGRETFPADFNVSDLLPINGGDGSEGFFIDGLNAVDVLGQSFTALDDINGDGIDDFALSSVLADPNGFNSGQSYAIFGREAGFGTEFDLSTLFSINGGDGSEGFVLNGADAGDISGRSIQSAGDINGDGVGDIILGAQGGDPNGFNSGEAYVIYGQKEGGFAAELVLDQLNGMNGFILEGVDPQDAAGFSAKGAGDVNGDGFDDILVGAPIGAPNGFASGETNLIFGTNFTQSVTHLGTEGNDILLGTAMADAIVAGLGNDTLEGNGGMDSLRGGAGDDLLKISDVTFQFLDGGSGEDSLVLDTNNLNIDFSSIGNARLEDLEIIDARGVGSNAIDLELADLLTMTDSNNRLTILGDATDSLAIDLSSAGFIDEGVSAGLRTFSSDTATLIASDTMDLSGIII